MQRILWAAVGAARRIGKWRVGVADEMILNPDEDKLAASEITFERVECILLQFQLARHLSGHASEIG